MKGSPKNLTQPFAESRVASAISQHRLPIRAARKFETVTAPSGDGTEHRRQRTVNRQFSYSPLTYSPRTPLPFALLISTSVDLQPAAHRQRPTMHKIALKCITA